MTLIGNGSNITAYDRTPLQFCQAAAQALDALLDLRLVGLSRWYRSAPIPASNQPDYINGVAHLRGPADPVSLLAALQAMETAAGRVRGAPNAPRTLDLDIIAMGPGGALCRASPDPILPHPRAHLRRFVLAPLSDVAPHWLHPRLHRTAAALLADLELQDVQPLAAGGSGSVS
jgi:2-amino-4-hydroxy-6-hydroxymethyldihydropteridine diphosphokinase